MNIKWNNSCGTKAAARPRAHRRTYLFLGSGSTGAGQVVSGSGITGLADGVVGELRRVNGEVDGMLQDLVQSAVCPVVRSGNDAEKI